MLLSTTITNWKSFYQETTFTMLATNERLKGEQLTRLPNHPRNRVLPISALFGPNAAGKSSFVEALSALKTVAIGERASGDPLPAVPNLVYGMDEPSALSVEFLAPVDDQRTPELRLRYDVEFTDSEISNETLWIRRSKGYALVFERDYTTVTVEPEFSKLDTNADKITNLAALMLEDNESFLSYSAGKLRIPPLVAAHGWFQDQLTIIGVDSFYPFLAARVASDHVFESAMNKELSKIDTGIERVRLEGIPHERIGVPDKILKSLISNVTKDQALAFVDSQGVPYIAQLKDSAGKRRGLADIAFSELQTIHLNDTGQEKCLRLSDESLGTRRFITLLPMMADLEEDGSRKVYVVDELENSMHSLLTSRLLGGALASSTPASRWQLIFTTHDLTLLEQDLLRRDEMWLAEKLHGMTELVRVTDFDTQKIRKGSDLLRAYMEGRLGAVPS